MVTQSQHLLSSCRLLLVFQPTSLLSHFLPLSTLPFFSRYCFISLESLQTGDETGILSHLARIPKCGKQNIERPHGTPSELRYERSQADLTEGKPRFNLPEQQALPNHRPSEADLKVYTGFAFSTQVIEVRFLNPLRDFALPVSQVANATSRVLSPNGTPLAVRIVKAHCVMKLWMTRDPLKTRSWSFPLRNKPLFTGWGSLRPGLLLITDPPRLTNAAMTDDAGSFDLDHWVVDPGLGGFDQW
ncbi:hypothetical protein PsorP6_002492 [Peronosclerospora sorghi]|uniref:Uncharacterized protein n=1 Tax=Peronosclerospora sorghi TaxID=230839 RepID=A0ACC0WUT0_9STRA|nr:hypothetical protein PsorP6_002492 [Peronosclerospora sorghi]